MELGPFWPLTGGLPKQHNNIKILEENGIRFIAVTKDWIRISRIRRAVSVARAGCRSRV
jgi:hypothetical protein